jgi:hypothetical protein
VSTLSDLASRLEMLEAADASSAEILPVLRQIDTPEQLWHLADGVAPYLPIMRMIYRRALELGSSDERARAYLASAHAFSGDPETAMAIVARADESATDDVLLEVWAVLAQEPSALRTRLEKALKRCPDSIRLRRRLLAEAMRTMDESCAKDVLADLIRDETDRDERQRLLQIKQVNGW